MHSVYSGIHWGMKELTSELEEKVGPKLFHSKDPRRKYIEEELSKVSVIRERSLTSEPLTQKKLITNQQRSFIPCPLN